MANINFDEPSMGNVIVDDKTAFAIKTSGKRSVGIMCEDISEWGDGGAIIGRSPKSIGVLGESELEFGVMGKSKLGVAVYGEGGGIGVFGKSTGGTPGVQGESKTGNGVKGHSTSGWGVYGSTNGTNGAGVWGQSHNQDASGHGVGVIGQSRNWIGVLGQSESKVGVHGECTHVNGVGVEGVNTNTQGGIGVYGKAKTAGRFEGDVEVTGDIRLVNADCAEDFDISESENVEAGTVMVLTENGSLQSSYQEYDKKVAGIVSGAIGYKPAIVLDRKQEQSENNNGRLPIALMGKVYCKVDARCSSIEIGDLLTTSSTKGYAMKAEDPMKAFGAVIGKALCSIKEGLGMIPVLVALQ